MSRGDARLRARIWIGIIVGLAAFWAGVIAALVCWLG